VNREKNVEVVERACENDASEAVIRISVQLLLWIVAPDKKTGRVKKRGRGKAGHHRDPARPTHGAVSCALCVNTGERHRPSPPPIAHDHVEASLLTQRRSLECSSVWLDSASEDAEDVEEEFVSSSLHP
jgi:hypothetical protein